MECKWIILCTTTKSSTWIVSGPFKKNQLETVTFILKDQGLIFNSMPLLYMHFDMIFQDSKNQNDNSICEVHVFDTCAIKQLWRDSRNHWHAECYWVGDDVSFHLYNQLIRKVLLKVRQTQSLSKAYSLNRYINSEENFGFFACLLLNLIVTTTTSTATVICTGLGSYTLYLLGCITIVLCGQTRSNQTVS